METMPNIKVKKQINGLIDEEF